MIDYDCAVSAGVVASCAARACAFAEFVEVMRFVVVVISHS
jgi:hypothetical protein